MKRINSRAKGCRGERMWRDVLKSHGFEARRGKQYSGDASAPDVIHNIPGIHFEVKCVEKLNIRQAMQQAETDASGLMPIVAHKINKGEWLVTMKASDFFTYRDNLLSNGYC